MTEGNYTLRWRGQDTGPFSTEQIRSMWENGEISGAYQVNTANGWLTVQDFIPQVDAVAEHERMIQEQERAAKAESDRRQLEQMRLAQQRERQLQEEAERREAEEQEKEIQENELTGKKYYLYLEGQKKGPFTANTVQVMLNAEKVDEQSLVWTREIGDWMPLKGFSELCSSANSMTPTHPHPNTGIHPPPNNPVPPYGHYHPNHPPPTPPADESTPGVLTASYVLACLSLLIPPLGTIGVITSIVSICTCEDTGSAVGALFLNLLFPGVAIAIVLQFV